MKDMSEYFGVIEDPRHSSYVTHKLEDVLTIVMCAVLCGLDKLDEIVAYEENLQENLKKEFGIEKYPSKSTISRVLSAVDGQAVGEVILKLMREGIVSRGEVIGGAKKNCTSELHCSPNGEVRPAHAGSQEELHFRTPPLCSKFAPHFRLGSPY